MRAAIENSEAKCIGFEIDKTHPAISRYLGAVSSDKGATLEDVTEVGGSLRVIKTPEELPTMRQAGQVTVAMVEASRAAISRSGCIRGYRHGLVGFDADSRRKTRVPASGWRVSPSCAVRCV